MPPAKVLPTVTPYQSFLQRWGRGCGNDICGECRNVCVARGRVPCDVLFVGEAPGESEDTLGQPFVGPSGYLLNHIIGEAFRRPNFDRGEKGRPLLTYCLTNVVCCIPRDLETGGKAAEPTPEEIRQCSPRLRGFIALCRPKLLVRVGKLAQDWVDSKARWSTPIPDGVQVEDLPHPAYILRQNEVVRDTLIRRSVVTLRDAVSALE
jgi:DNA polymerase